VAEAGQLLFDLHMQVQYKPPLFDQGAVVRIEHDTATGRHHLTIRSQHFGQRRAFALAEPGLALVFKNGRDTGPGMADDFLIGIDKPQPELHGQLAPERGFASAHRADQDEVRCWIHIGMIACYPIVMPTPSIPPSLPPSRPCWRTKLSLYWQLVRGDRPIGWLLLLWPTWWALWLAAGGFPPWWTLVVFSLGVWLTRSAGCILNDYADRWLDPQVERTRERPLATGAVKGREALILCAILLLLAFALVLSMNRLTVLMSLVAVGLAASYPYLKRYTHLPQVYLGMTFGWGIPMAFAAVLGEVPTIGWVLYAANIVWATAYDTWYAMVDREDDIRAGSKSTAILFGRFDLVIQLLLYAVMFVLLGVVGGLADLGWAYWVGVTIASGLVGWEFIITFERERSACFRAFLHNHWVGMAVFVGIALETIRD